MPYTRNYSKVADRLRAAQDELQSVRVDNPIMLNDSYGTIRVRVTLKDGREGDGIAAFDLSLMNAVDEQGRPHKVRYMAKATSPIEVAQTKALGMALAKIGYFEDGTIASEEEISDARAE